jgi:hypothetical protein
MKKILLQYGQRRRVEKFLDDRDVLPPRNFCNKLLQKSGVCTFLCGCGSDRLFWRVVYLQMLE